MRNIDNDISLSGGEYRWFEDSEDLFTALAEDIENGDFSMAHLTHVEQWHKADMMTQSKDSDIRLRGERQLDRLENDWFDRSSWVTSLQGLKITGTLKAISRYGYVEEHTIDPMFTIEFTDPDNPDGYLMTITGHFSRFQQAPKGGKA